MRWVDHRPEQLRLVGGIPIQQLRGGRPPQHTQSERTACRAGGLLPALVDAAVEQRGRGPNRRRLEDSQASQEGEEQRAAAQEISVSVPRQGNYQEGKDRKGQGNPITLDILYNVCMYVCMFICIYYICTSIFKLSEILSQHYLLLPGSIPVDTYIHFASFIFFVKVYKKSK